MPHQPSLSHQKTSQKAIPRKPSPESHPQKAIIYWLLLGFQPKLLPSFAKFMLVYHFLPPLQS